MLKKSAILMALIAISVLLSSILTPDVGANKNESADKRSLKDPASRTKIDSKTTDPLYVRSHESAVSKEFENGLLEASATDAGDDIEQDDPDLPPRSHGIDKKTYLRLRDEFVARLRGVEPGRPFDPRARGRAIEQLQHRQEEMREAGAQWFTLLGQLAFPALSQSQPLWVSLGPSPVPNGSAQGGGSVAVTGRVTAVVVDPTNSSKVYLGTAQGGVWRSLDGGTTWISIFDDAQSLAIGALALAPSNPSILYVGTGEFNQCADCFFGAGLYRIDNADTAANLVGPINPQITLSGFTYNVFNGRAIAKILVHPNDPATVFVATGRGIGGSGANSFGLVPGIATRGLYRSTNATAAASSVTFQKLVVTTDNSPDSPPTGNVDTSDMVMEPGNPANVVVSVIGATGTNGGLYRTTNALAATPTFTQVLPLGSGIRANLTINKVGSAITLYAATSETPVGPLCTGSRTGALRKSTDGGVTWSSQLTGGQGFCGGQCFYNIAVAVDPNDANIVYLGGNARGTCSDAMKKSTDGGASFFRDDNGLHADSHALFFDTATSPSTIYAGNDGGIWKRPSNAPAGTPWTNLNNAPLDTIQFESLAVHPIDRNFTIGGTQDNGTEAQQTSQGNWINAEGGDGGYTLIDQSSPDTSNVTMYLTFFNLTNTQIGFDRALVGSCLSFHNGWSSRGFGLGTSAILSCDGTPFGASNGLQGTDNVLFYAPMALGPTVVATPTPTPSPLPGGVPPLSPGGNTLYFGTDRLYRSINKGDTMIIVSQSSISNPGGSGSPISTIAISPQDDNYRLVGLQNGQVWATSTGSSTLVNLSSASFPDNPNGSTTNRFVGRAIVDPNNKEIAYITFSFFAPAGQGVWKITNLGAAAGASPTPANWVASGNGIPSIPINAFAVDPLNSNDLYAGTDIGVYYSRDAGASWSPYGTGLPRAAVFDMKIQSPNRLLRVATHGRGMWEIATAFQGSFANSIQLSNSSYSVQEGAGSLSVTVTRSGDSSGPATINYATSDTAGLFGCNVNNHQASERCDYATTVGTLRFAAGETTKSFVIPIIDDALVEGDETFTVTLSGPTGATLGSPSTATVTIVDNDSDSTTQNPIDGAQFFITQQYIDFLGRLPDPVGLANWLATLNGCPNNGFGENDNPGCDRVHISAGFFLSDEFRVRGYWAYKFYEVGFDRRPLYTEFVPDMAQVGGAQSPASEALSKAAYTDAFEQRPEFISRYSGLTSTAYVNALEQNAEVTVSNKASLIMALDTGQMTHGQVLRNIVESQAVDDRFFIRAFVAMQYFGYLRRDPDTTGYNNWLTTLTADPNNYRHMIFGFLYSSEYRGRFGPP